MHPADWAKAITAALVSFGGGWEIVTMTDSAKGDVVTGNEWVRIIVASVVAGLATYLVPNAVASITKTPPAHL